MRDMSKMDIFIVSFLITVSVEAFITYNFHQPFNFKKKLAYEKTTQPMRLPESDNQQSSKNRQFYQQAMDYQYFQPTYEDFMRYGNSLMLKKK
ncbi:unnamed protein product [Dracunculus medinensis]|uniref:DUF3613 domain-containing protein n=1 Tax=Dracunculus medinensis TaxID=318479 RepID=A0A0N4U295_DRAME|nr:unnamed protein product [Dracunculus medinensis]